MKRVYQFRGLLLLLIGFLSLSITDSNENVSYHTIHVQIGNIRNTDGRIQLQVFKDQKGYEEKDPWKAHFIEKKGMKNKSLFYTIKGLETGTYGIAILDDENKNTKMDYGWVLPKEGFGFADYYHTGWTKPHFDDFKFYLNSDKTVKIIVRYL